MKILFLAFIFLNSINLISQEIIFKTGQDIKKNTIYRNIGLNIIWNYNEPASNDSNYLGALEYLDQRNTWHFIENVYVKDEKYFWVVSQDSIGISTKFKISFLAEAKNYFYETKPLIVKYPYEDPNFDVENWDATSKLELLNIQKEKVSFEYGKKIYELSTNSNMNDEQKRITKNSYKKEKDDAISEIEKKESDALVDLYNARLNKFFNPIPVRRSQDAEIFYNDKVSNNEINLLSSSTVVTDFNGKFSVNNEVFNDFLGPVKISIGFLLSNKTKVNTDSNGIIVDSNKIQEDAIQRLIGGGANFTSIASFPLLLLKSSGFNSQTLFNFRIGVDVPALGTVNTEDIPISFSTSLDINGSIVLSKKIIKLFFYEKALIALGNQKFKNYLFANDNESREKNTFTFLNQFSFGINIANILTLSYNFNWGNNFVNNFMKDNLKNTLSISVNKN